MGGEDIPASLTHCVDLQLLALHRMAEEPGLDAATSLLPSLKKTCSFFLSPDGRSNGQGDSGGVHNAATWELSKKEQCSDWGRRPLTSNQLEYAGLDAAILIILLAEIIRK